MIEKPTRICIINGSPEYSRLFAPLGEVSGDIDHFCLNPEKYKAVIFTGGEDVTPTLYGENSPEGMCSYNVKRDIAETKIFRLARMGGVKMIGICRGVQFLNVMCGGKLLHHISGHGWAGKPHNVVFSNGKIVGTNSFHHQMVIPAVGVSIVAWAKEKLSEVYYGDEDRKVHWPGPEVEGIYVPWNSVLGVQWHPEISDCAPEGNKAAFQMFKDFLELSDGAFEKSIGINNKVREELKS